MQSNDIVNELSTNFIEYAVAVNTDRAIPDARDGLKPVAKRIIWSAFEEKRFSNKPHVKAARIVGDVMGKYHPHGDSSIYGAMVRLSQDWIMRYPLIDWHGSNGNITGDGPAAARYTEARLAKVSEDGLLNHIKENNVDFIPNYDESLAEPVCLPSAFPNLLVNPNSGIGVAMACSWGCHNLGDVANAIYSYMDGTVPVISAPDFPTGGLIINGNECPDIISKGRGTVKIRARHRVEGNKIIFYEVPYGQTIEGLLKELGDVCEKKEIEGVSDAHDESNKKGIRIVVEVSRGHNPDAVAERIYQKTNFQSSFSYNQVALIDKTPTELSLEDCCRVYVRHNQECLVKELNFNLTKATDRLEVVNGLLKALVSIDEIVAMIRGSESAAAARETLINKYEFTENQAKAILAMRLSSLAKLEALELNKEAEELNEKIKNNNEILNSEGLQLDHIRRRLEELVDKYGDERRTEIANIEITKEIKEKVKKEVVPEDIVIIVNNNGDIKKVAKNKFKVQHKSGKGVKSVDETILSSFSTNTLDTLLVFTSDGKMYRLGADKIPDGNVNLSTLLPFNVGEKVITVTNMKDETSAEYVVFFTKQGLIKKTELAEYKSIKKTTGTQAIKIREGDSLANVTLLNDEDIIIITKKGMTIRLDTTIIAPIGRVTNGRKAIKLAEDDEVVIGLPISKSEKKKYLIVMTEDGNAIKTDITEFTKQNSNGKGLKCVAAGTVVNGAICDDNDNILIVGYAHSKCIPVSEIVENPRGSAGRAVVKDDKIRNLVKL